MTTTPGQMHFHISTEATAGETMTTTITATTTPISAIPSRVQHMGEAGPSVPKTDSPSAQQIKELNFYLKRMSIGGNAEITQTESLEDASDYKSSTPMDLEKLYLRNLMLMNQVMEGLDRRLANGILRAGQLHNLEENMEAAEECGTPETRSGIIRRVETNLENGGKASDDASRNSEQRNENSQWPSGTNNGGRSRRVGDRSNWRTSQQNYSRNRQHRSRYVGGMERRTREARRLGIAENSSYWDKPFYNKYPYMKNRCSNCGQAGHSNKGCFQPRVCFCFHCGKVGEVCNLTSQQSLNQRYQYMENRCRNCGQAGHRRKGCFQKRVFFCFHCGKVGEMCNLNSQYQLSQNSS